MIGKSQAYYGNCETKTALLPVKPLRIKHCTITVIKIFAIITSIAVIGLNSYMLMSIKDDLTKVHYKLYGLFESLDESTFLMKSDVRPKVDLINRMLSYELPTSILAAFQKSNTKLTNSLGDMTINLENLISLYKSILGFDEDWTIMPNTQHLTCTLIPSNDADQVYERMMKRKKQSGEDDNQSKEVHPLLDRDYPHSGDYYYPENYELPSIEAMRKNGTDPRLPPSFFTEFLKFLKARFNVNESNIYFGNSFLNWSRSIYMADYQSPGSSAVAEVSLTPKPDQNLGKTPTPAPSHLRRRRFVTDFMRKKDLGTFMQKFSDNVMIKVHTVRNTVEDMCSMTKKVLKFSNDQCSATDDLIKFINCIIG